MLQCQRTHLILVLPCNHLLFRIMHTSLTKKVSLNLLNKFTYLIQVKLKNYFYKNYGDLKLKNETKKWGLDQLSFSNGAAYADLDNDGDLEIVVNM